MQHPRTLLQVTPDFETSGIMHDLKTLGAPWADVSDVDSLELEYYCARSGYKCITSIVRRLLVDGVLTADNQLKLAKILMTRYGDNWGRLWDAIRAEYNPLDNYNMEERENEAGGRTRAPDITHETKYNSETATRESGTYGFNSNDPVPTDTSKDVMTGGNSAHESGTESEGTLNNRRLTRRGNIGVTTTQQMLESEIDLRSMRNYFELIYRDIDSLLVLSVYGGDDIYDCY